MERHRGAEAGDVAGQEQRARAAHAEARDAHASVGARVRVAPRLRACDLVERDGPLRLRHEPLRGARVGRDLAVVEVRREDDEALRCEALDERADVAVAARTTLDGTPRRVRGRCRGERERARHRRARARREAHPFDHRG